MSPYSLYHYHAECPLMTEPWINAASCAPTAEVIQAALLLLHTTTSSSCSGGPLQWISRSLHGLQNVTNHRLPLAASTVLGFKSVSLTMFKDAEVQRFHFTPTSSLRGQFWILALSIIAVSAPVPFVLQYPVIPATLLNVWRSCAYLCSYSYSYQSHFKITSACSAILLASPLSSSLCSRSPSLTPLTQMSRWADASPRQIPY